MKLTTNTNQLEKSVDSSVAKLLKILIILFGLICTIVIFGLLTRPQERVVEIATNASEQGDFKQAMDAYVQRVKLEERNRYLEIRETLMEEELKKANREIVISSLTPMELYVNYAYEIADKYYPDIHPEYVCAIIYHESRFDPTVTNKKTEVQGLCQINPKWHTKRANELGVTDLYDPYGNILVCFDILNELSLSGGFSYALNFYAGGYPYANRYSDEPSPFERQLAQITDEQNFAQYVLPYSIT